MLKLTSMKNIKMVFIWFISMSASITYGQNDVSSKELNEEWLRTKPDVIVYLPKSEHDGDNEHFLVFEAPKSDEVLAMWTQSSVEGRGDNRAVLARSLNGEEWSEPITIAGKGPGRTDEQASWAFPVVSEKGRIYCFYNKEIDKIDMKQISGVMGCRYSDDNGYSWIIGKDIWVPKNKYDNPDPDYPANWIVWQKPIRDSKGRYIAGYTQWTSEKVIKKASKNWTDVDSRSAFMRFENIDENPLPEDLIISWLPVNREGLEVPHKINPEISVSQEPALVLLPDNRLFTVMRTMTGHIWYSVSEDDGETWRAPEVLRYKDGGKKFPTLLRQVQYIHYLTAGIFSSLTIIMANVVNMINLRKNGIMVINLIICAIQHLLPLANSEKGPISQSGLANQNKY